MQAFSAYEALRKHGGVELGDLVLASGSFYTASEAEATAALAPFTEPTASLATARVAKYLLAGRAYRRSLTPDTLRPVVTDGVVGAMSALREVSALLVSERPERAAPMALALPAHAVELRLIAAMMLSSRGGAAADVARVWDSLAIGQYRNVARAAAALAFARDHGSDELADRVARLVADVDLRAEPADLSTLRYHVQSSRRGRTGWDLMWSTWRDRVLAGDSFEHVMSLMPHVGEHRGDLSRILERAAQLADQNTERVLAVARLAKQHGQPARAIALVTPIAKARPTRELLQLLGELALQQGRPAEALTHFEAAQDAGADEAVDLTTVRRELAQLIAVAQQVAMDASGAARTTAVERALVWGKRWRAIDPANPQIDRTLGHMLLLVGDPAEAWRQLSTVIERDPMSGVGYTMVAEAFEAQGRVAEALPYWQQAIVIEQTDPTPRLRKAKALIALGKMAEGDALLGQITGGKWNSRWDMVVYEAREVAARGRRK
jgi:tetratricopeptide (TPR) repeat protein